MKYLLIILMLFTIISCGEIPEKADLNLYYTTSQKGEMKGCGCRTGGGGLHMKKHSFDLNKELYPNSLLVDGGQFIYEWVSEDTLQTERMLKLYEMLEYDAVNVTPFDVQVGVDIFKKYAAGKTNFISASILNAKNDELIFEPYVIKKINCNGIKIKIGIIGFFEFNYAAVENINRKNGLKLAPIDETINKYGKELREKCDFVIALGHTKWNRGKEIATQYRDYIDVYINGNSEFQDYFDQNSIIIAQTHAINKNYGIMTLTFGKNKNLLEKKNQFIWVNKNDPFDESVQTYLKNEGILK